MMDRRSFLAMTTASAISLRDSSAIAFERPVAAPLSGSPLLAPIHIKSVGLRVRNLSQMTAFYRYAIGLEVTERGPDFVDLGTPGAVLLRLTSHPNATIAPAAAAGLYHTAFLLPSRSDLGAWMAHAIDMRVPLTGAADHLVSEAVYLNDPEGNGIEIYRDREPSEWRWDGGSVVMGTRPFDSEGVLADAEGKRYAALPAEACIGHVHLKVGSLEPARSFYADTLGLDVTRSRDGALFMSSGGYHHHLAVNTWESMGAGVRPEGTTGLDWIDIQSAHASADPVQKDAFLSDRWGTRIRLSAP